MLNKKAPRYFEGLFYLFCLNINKLSRPSLQETLPQFHFH